MAGRARPPEYKRGDMLAVRAAVPSISVVLPSKVLVSATLSLLFAGTLPLEPMHFIGSSEGRIDANDGRILDTKGMDPDAAH